MTLRDIAHHLEALVARAALALVGRLRPETASNIGGAVARAIGPLLPVSRVADDNLRRALPALDAAERRRVIRGVWENLGRTVGEFPHVRTMGPCASGPGWEVVGADIIAAIQADGRKLIMVSGHFSNWEVNAAAANISFGRQFGIFYRAASNPIVDAEILRMRDLGGSPHFAKGTGGARAAIAYLRQGGSLGMLVDQKMNDGIPVEFFGRIAMTAPAAASMAQRFDCLLVPCHVERIAPARFRYIVEPPIAVPDSGDRLADIAGTTRLINQHLERWITAHPEQWLWLHRRWPKENFMTDAVLLDLDGTLSDSRPGIESCLRAAMAEMGHPLDPATDLGWAIGPPTEDVFGRLLAPFDDPRVGETVAVYRRHYAAGGWSDNTPYDGIAEALAALSGAGLALYLATSKRIDFARQILAHFGFARHFAGVYGAELDGSRSHKPEMIAHIVATHGLVPDRAVMVGDRAFDIAGAHANGLRAIGVLWGYGSAQEFDNAGADAVIAAPGEILPAVRRMLGGR